MAGSWKNLNDGPTVDIFTVDCSTFLAAKFGNKNPSGRYLYVCLSALPFTQKIFKQPMHDHL